MAGFAQVECEPRKHFLMHLSALNNAITPAEITEFWQDIANCYNEPQRAYHTLDHLQQLFGHFEQIKHQLTEYYHARLEEQARDNIKHEINLSRAY